MNPAIFREYDIRGLVGADLSPEVVESIGKAFGTTLVQAGKKTVVVGRDVRLSSEDFATAVARGLQSTGINVIDVGVVPTPVLYYAIIEFQTDGGIMITGSHNPIEYNGIKLCAGTLAIYGDEIQQLRRLIETANFSLGSGTFQERDIVESYVAQLLDRFNLKKKHHIAIDCGNGVAGLIIPRILQAAGQDVVELYTEPDGNFPNHLPDPEVPKYMNDLSNAVVDTKLDAGFGFDGDGDRLGLITNVGEKISADWLLLLFARDLLERHPGGKVRFDVKCSDFLFQDVEAHGGIPIMGRTGHSILKRDMKELDAIVGGELSGHIVFGRDYHLIDDPFYSALKILELMEKHSESSAELFASFPKTFSTAEIKIPVPEQRKFETVSFLMKDFALDRKVDITDGARVSYNEGWGLVRASNTTANLTLRFEARSEFEFQNIVEDFRNKLSVYPYLDLENLDQVRPA